MAWEYKVVPAPSKGQKARGIKGPEGRFAHALESLLNEAAQEGWEFWRAETLPSEERSGLTGSQTIWRHVMVFRRPAEPATPEESLVAPVALIEDKADEVTPDPATQMETEGDIDTPDEDHAPIQHPPVFEHAADAEPETPSDPDPVDVDDPEKDSDPETRP